MKKYIYYCLCFLLMFSFVFSQSNSNCLTKFQIIKMQNSTIDEVRLALNNENWEFADAKSLNSGNTTCNFISWKNYKEKLSVYNLSEKQNFVVYHSDSECFKNPFKCFTKNTSKVGQSINIFI